MDELMDALRHLKRLGLLLLCSLQGTVCEVGVAMALASDVCVATADSQVHLASVDGCMGDSFVADLVCAVGTANAWKLCTSSHQLSAHEAAGIGLLQEVAPSK